MNYVKLDSLNNKIIAEEIKQELPYYGQIRDFLVTDTVKNLFLIRHGETFFNLENRIGGNSGLTEKGRVQAEALANYFKTKKIPYMCIIGDREVENKTLSVRKHKDGDIGSMTVEQLKSKLMDEIQRRAQD